MYFAMLKPFSFFALINIIDLLLNNVTGVKWMHEKQHWVVILIVLCFGQFLVFCGMTMIVPFLPLYIQELGIHDPVLQTRWAGLIFGINFLSTMIMQPIWGAIADRYGRKMMLVRSSLGMAVMIVCTGFATSVWHLFILRFLNGTISGFQPAATGYLSANTPKDKMGFALGILQAGGISGLLIGPLVGGWLAGMIGFRAIFLVTGVAMFIAAICCILFIKEKNEKNTHIQKPVFTIWDGYRSILQNKQLNTLFFATFIIQFILLSSTPLLPLYVQSIVPTPERVAFFAGLVSALTGLANMISSPILGKLSDRIGSIPVMTGCMLIASIFLTTHAFAKTITFLLISRFLLGLCIGGITPAIQSLIRKLTPQEKISRTFGLNSSALSLGNFAGPILAGFSASYIGIAPIFIIQAILMFISGIIVPYLLRKHATVIEHRSNGN